MCSAFFPRYFFGMQKSNSPNSAPRFFSRFCFFGAILRFFQKQYVFLHCFDQTAKIEVALDIDFPKMGSAFFFRVFVFWYAEREFPKMGSAFFFRVFFFSEGRNVENRNLGSSAQARALTEAAAAGRLIPAREEPSSAAPNL